MMLPPASVRRGHASGRAGTAALFPLISKDNTYVANTVGATLRGRPVGKTTVGAALRRRPVGKTTVGAALRRRPVGKTIVGATLRGRPVGKTTVGAALRRRPTVGFTRVAEHSGATSVQRVLGAVCATYLNSE